MANLLPAPQAVLGQALAFDPEELRALDSELARLDVRDLSTQLSQLREELARELAR